MNKNFINKSKKSVNLSEFKDPIAEKTKWKPAKSGGTNFRTHKLFSPTPYRAEFKPSIGAKIIYIFLCLIGLTTIIGFLFTSFKGGKFDPEFIFPIIIGLIFIIIGGGLFYSGSKPIVFDKMSGYFWKGNQDPKQIMDKSKIKHYCKLSDIHALQIISENCRGDKSSFYSYELNLVLINAKRINIIDHGNLKKLREDAEILSQFLGKPVWDGA